MFRSWLTLISIACSIHLSVAQMDSLVNSGYQLHKAKALSDSGLYDLAISELKRIDPRDTNYYQSLSQLADIHLTAREYEKAIEVAQSGLERPSSRRASLLTTLGMAYTQMQEYDKARTVFDKGISEFPFYAALQLQKGKMYYASKNYDAAEKFFFQALNHSPYNSISHLYLATIAILRGEKVHGMMAMGVYLAINNSNNSQLSLVEKFVKNELTDEFSLLPSSTNSFLRLDAIIRSRIAMEEGYKTRIPINAGIVRQYQLMFDQLSLAGQNVDTDDPWVKYYLAIYTALIKSSLQDAFVYHILKSTNFSQVTDWTRKNEKTLTQFYESMNEGLRGLRETKVLPELGFSESVSCRYDNSSNIESIGTLNAKGEETGRWIYYFPNGVLKARGEFDGNGNKKGRWEYYNDLGYLTSIEDFESGLRERYTEQGKPWQKYFLKDGKVDGEVFIYFSCGTTREHLIYSNGLRNGKAEVYSQRGTVVERLFYQNDSIQGKYESFYDSGEKQLVSNYKNGELEGTSTRYHRNGKVSSVGLYEEGKAIGKWSFYHNNGQLSEVGEYKAGNPVGEFRYFDRRGNLTEVRSYNDEGELHGENTFYRGGAMHYKMLNENGKTVSATNYDMAGKEIGTDVENDGKLLGKSYFITGEIRSEYSYQDGKAHGLWKYYNRSGNLESQNNYVNGEVDGEAVHYYASREVKSRISYQNGELHGSYHAFYPDGKVQAQGWYQGGAKQQRWLYYHPNGEVKSDLYYLNDEVTGVTKYFATDGKLYSTDELLDSEVEDYRIFDSSGTQISTLVKGERGPEILATHKKTGKNARRIELRCGQFDGVSETYFEDGSLFQSLDYLNGKTHGSLDYRGPLGEPYNTGHYVNGNAEGTWTWYHPNGQKETVGFFTEDERDSLWTYYYENGIRSKTYNYENGTREGISQIFGPDGDLILEKKYDKGDLIAYRATNLPGREWVPFSGQGVIQVNYANGKPALVENFENGSYHGAVKLFYKNGNLFSHLNYVYGDYEGSQLTYYPDGKLRRKINYLMDDEHGTTEWFDPSGKLERSEQYQHGFLDGLSASYKNGKKTKEVNFWYGLPQE